MEYKTSICKNSTSNDKIVFCYKDTCSDANSEKVFLKLKEQTFFNANRCETYLVSSFSENSLARTIFVGLGEENGIVEENIRLSMAEATKVAAKNNISNIDLFFDEGFIDGSDTYIFIKSAIESIILTLYSYSGYKSKSTENYNPSINIVTRENERIISAAIIEGKALGMAVNKARDLINEPPNKLTPENLAKSVVDCGQEFGFEVSVYDESWILENKLKALYEVGKGSDNKPRFIVIKYNGDSSNAEYVGIVGKGVTFDSGGYNLKQSAGLEYMKSDMGGAAAVIGLMCAVAKTKLKRNLICAIPTCENMIGSGAYRAGDVIDTLSGKTVEVSDTDAEGRLIIADAIYYLSSNDSVTHVIDIATLTGASALTFGSVCSAVISNNDDFYNSLQKASEKTSELIWRLPTFPEYKGYLASSIADIANKSSRKGASTILGGMFIEEFVNKKPWLHIDMANKNASMMPSGYTPKGPTGYGVRLLYQLLKDIV